MKKKRNFAVKFWEVFENGEAKLIPFTLYFESDDLLTTEKAESFYYTVYAKSRNSKLANNPHTLIEEIMFENV
jgi:hypothetical protein